MVSNKLGLLITVLLFMKVMPDMLCSIQRHSEYHLRDALPDQYDDDIKTLSVVYEIMRRSDKALSIRILKQLWSNNEI